MNTYKLTIIKNKKTFKEFITINYNIVWTAIVIVVVIGELVYILLQQIQAMTFAKGFLLACLRFFERYKFNEKCFIYWFLDFIIYFVNGINEIN